MFSVPFLKKKRLVLSLVGIAGVLLLALLGVLVGPLHLVHASGGGATLYTHTATRANTRGDTTLLDNAVSNNNPDALIFVTANWNPGGVHTSFDNHQVGVRYDASAGKWGIFNEDHTTMPVNASFNVYVLPGSSLDTAFVQTTTTLNTSHNLTLIDNAGLNGNPSASFLVTQNRNPGGKGGHTNNHAIGVQYDAHSGKWGIFNEDHSSLPPGTAFNVVSLVGVTDALTQVATQANIHSGATCIDSSVSNGNPEALVFITPVSSTPLTDVAAVQYQASAGKWCIFHSSHHLLPPGTSFFVLPTEKFV